MDISKIHRVLLSEPKYRFKQVNQALFVDYISFWDEASVLPKTLREKLKQEAPINIKAEVFSQSDSEKALISLEDGEIVETVLIKGKGGRYTVCVSSQVGCAMNCSFCATGQMGFIRNLSRDEIVEQIVFWNRRLKINNEKIDNVVYMGMGEPFNNYDEFIKSVKFINDPETLNIGARKISVSTVGIIEGIKRLAGEKIQVNLAISLHAPNDNIRESIIPSAKRYQLQNILKVVNDYIRKTNRRVMFEYMLLKGINDSDEQAVELAKIMRQPLYLVNLIPYNPTTKRYQVSSRERIEEFKRILEDYKVVVTIRKSFGQDIAAACGQLKRIKNVKENQ